MKRYPSASRVLAVLAAVALTFIPMATGGLASASSPNFNPYGGLDCNGQSPVQKPIHPDLACTDIRGFAGVNNRNNWGSRFYDNGEYIGHDEPDMTFYSTRKGSGDDVTWKETLGSDPTPPPTDVKPGSDVAHWFELSSAPWFSMALCDPTSYPQLPCVPNSDKNAPACPSDGAPKCLQKYPGAGSAFMEMQFYPPGFAPWADSVSCDNTHWCAALTIDSLECTDLYSQCANNCEEPINFAFIQRNGIPTGPPAPQNQDLASDTPNSDTLLMNPGDKISVHIFDAPVPGGPGHAVEAVVDDLTSNQSGWMQASAANGFAETSMANCFGQPFNFEPEYQTAAPANYIPWAALVTNISTEFETGHFEPCTSVTDQIGMGYGGAADPIYNACTGPYETELSGEGNEYGGAACYTAGDTHGTLASDPNEIAGCLDNYYQNGDLDFDGTPYWPEWPTGTAATASLPGSFVESPPVSKNHQFSQYRFQTDVALSEPNCGAVKGACAVPPPTAPGKFYPYWSLANHKGTCAIEFGNVSAGSNLTDFSKDAQFGTDQFKKLGYHEFEGKVRTNACAR